MAASGEYRHAMGTLTKSFAWFFRFSSASLASPRRGRFTDAASRQARDSQQLCKTRASQSTHDSARFLSGFRATTDSSDRLSDSGQTECLSIPRYRQARSAGSDRATTPNSQLPTRKTTRLRSRRTTAEGTLETSASCRRPARSSVDEGESRKFSSTGVIRLPSTLAMAGKSTCLAFSSAVMKPGPPAHPPERHTPAALPGGAWETMPPRGIRGPRRRTRGRPGSSCTADSRRSASRTA